MGDFTELQIFSDGSGDFHLNRFRIAFEPPAGRSAAALASDLIDNFPTYLGSPYATVQLGDRSHEGKRTLRFHGYARLLGLDLAAPHDDWVVVSWVDRNVGFTAQTLKREFADFGDDVGAGGGVLLAGNLPVVGALAQLAGPVLWVAGAVGTVHYNRMHFLAGRRSWRISAGDDFGLSDKVVVLETVAVERFSSLAFRAADTIAGLEARIPDVWIALLENFVRRKGLEVVPQKLPGARWRHRSNVDYVQLSFDDIGDMQAEREFQEILRLYPSILPAFARRWLKD